MRRGRVEEALPGTEPRETSSGTCAVRRIAYPLDHRLGAQPLDDLERISEAALELLAPLEGLRGASLADLLFLDVECTGLGGAGTLVFLVCTARVEDSALVVRQYFALAPEQEGAMLDAVIEDARLPDEPVLVTYNGRTFDAPLLDERATMHRRRAGFEALRQLDLLRSARSMYRPALPSCRLADVERGVLSLSRRDVLGEDDIEGAEIPARYFRWLRSRDPRWISPIAAHNELDVVALAAFAGRVLAALADPLAAAPLDRAGVGLLLAARGSPDAVAVLDSALAHLPPSTLRRMVLTTLARLHKSHGRGELAEPLWIEAAQPSGRAGGQSVLAPLVELAKHYEHRARDFHLALEAVDRAIEAVTAGIEAHDIRRAAAWRAALEHRRARLLRRLERARLRTSRPDSQGSPSRPRRATATP